jgi:cell shape-determining protein MreC
MYNLFMVLVLSLVCSTSFAGNCDNGSYRTPVRTATKSVVNFTEKVVASPVRGFRNTRARIQSNRVTRSNGSCTNRK